MSQLNSSDSTSSHKCSQRYAIIGAGITGLSAAQALLAREPSADVTIYEGSDRVGGIIQTVQSDGFMLELGPDSFITNKRAAVRLCDDIGFSDQLIPTDNQHRRSLVLSNGKPAAVPEGFLLMAPSNLAAIASTEILSEAGRLRMLQETQIPPAAEITDESLADFVRRRFGSEALDRLVQPLVGGIYTSDPEKLSIMATLPRFQQMEQDYGSVTVGTLLQNLKAGKGQSTAGNDPSNNVTAESTASSGARYGLFAAPRNGMSSLIEALRDWVTRHDNCRIQFNTKATNIRKLGDEWQVGLSNGIQETYSGVVVTLPTHQAAQLLPNDAMSPLKNQLEQIEYASSAIVVSTHQLSDFDHPLDAFGLVIPSREERDILAVSFSSRKFPGRAPGGSIILRTFVGGATQPHLFEKSDEEVRTLVNQELTQMLGMKTPAQKSWVARYGKAMPQYHIGHLDRVAEIERLAAEQTGLEFAGSAYHGVGIPDSVASGQNAASRLFQSTQA